MSNSKEGTSCPDGYRALSTAELRELLQSDDKMDQIIRLNEKFQELQVDREMLLTSNRSLAEESLAQRPCLNNGKLQLAEKYKELSNLITTCWEKQSQLGEFTSPLRRHRFGGSGGTWFGFHAAEMLVGDRDGKVTGLYPRPYR
ncbi:vacuolar protein sorting-associated protein 37D [Girardinichthys multiradiatus]|uniref:vacuolar protein sorting-associated protein 37D n=1 Tax=Girardinichthys multiradiatus TaxID=208333 RepID=UPI001FAC353D|nr:vacuolar protein sorting-associated protein 37D [Girardinichthys multiradiatus]